MPVIAPASEAPKHHAARLMLMTRPRRRAGQVSATSIEPSDHSPFSAKADDRPRDHEHREGGREGDDRHQEREQRDIDRKQRAPPVAVGKPRPDIEAGDADEERDLQARPVLRHGERELPDDQRRDQREDHAVHAVETPAEAIGDGDVPVRRRDAAVVGDGPIVGVPHVLQLERTDACWTIRRRGRQPTRLVGCGRAHGSLPPARRGRFDRQFASGSAQGPRHGKPVLRSRDTVWCVNFAGRRARAGRAAPCSQSTAAMPRTRRHGWIRCRAPSSTPISSRTGPRVLEVFRGGT